jgi:quinol monooxygenase YgiN
MNESSSAPSGRIHRYAHCRAVSGRGEELAGLLLEVAAGLHGFDGCDMYIINRAADDPDVIWVTELWASREALEGSLKTPETQAMIPRVMALVAEWGDPIDVVPLGGHGLP